MDGCTPHGGCVSQTNLCDGFLACVFSPRCRLGFDVRDQPLRQRCLPTPQAIKKNTGARTDTHTLVKTAAHYPPAQYVLVLYIYEDHTWYVLYVRTAPGMGVLLCCTSNYGSFIIARHSSTLGLYWRLSCDHKLDFKRWGECENNQQPTIDSNKNCLKRYQVCMRVEVSIVRSHRKLLAWRWLLPSGMDFDAPGATRQGGTGRDWRASI